MKRPSKVLILDANIVIPIVSGRTRATFLRTAVRHRMATTVRVQEEVDGRLRGKLGRADLADQASMLFGGIATVETRAEPAAMTDAEDVLRAAPASGNGTVNGAHVLVAAWMLDADVWTHDRDFAGTGVASWSTANLLAALD